MSKNKKIGLFFGAGAEISYGMPSGGEFALDIFRAGVEEGKNNFNEMRSKISKSSAYARNWLPKNYEARTIYSFGKNNYSQIVASSLENNSELIINFLNKFDEKANQVKISLELTTIQDSISKLSGKEFGKENYKDIITLNVALDKNVKLFESNYFSSFLHILENQQDKSNKEQWFAKLKEIAKAFLHLLVGASGKNFLSEVNDTIFETKNKKLKIFDDFHGYFSFDYNKITGLDLILERKPNHPKDLTETGEIVTEFAFYILQKLYEEIFDYQALVNSHYPYLFSPKADWAKFSRITTFLYSIQNYIEKKYDESKEKNISEGYYHDVLNIKDSVHIIGTSNYTKLITDIIQKDPKDPKDVIFVNGTTEKYYDPYLNRTFLKDSEKKADHFIVPFLFTQNNVKPLTTVDMAKDYVKLFDDYVECDSIAVIGFGFNDDDGHINSLFRNLIDKKNKKIIIFDFDSCDKKYYIEKLRISNEALVDIVPISKDRKVKDKNWTEYLLEKN